MASDLTKRQIRPIVQEVLTFDLHMAGIAEYGLILIGVFLGAGIGYLLAKAD